MSAALPFFPRASKVTTRETQHPLSSRPFSFYSSPSSPRSSSSCVFCLGRRSKELDHVISDFNWAPNPTPRMFVSLIEALDRDGLHRRALSAFVLMLQATVALPDYSTFLLILGVCARLASIDSGQQIHGLLLKFALLSVEEDGVSLANGLIHMYAKCDRMDLALRVFERLPARNLVSWNSMIAGYARGEGLDRARELFDKMPDRNMISWNSIIYGYAKNGLPEEALSLFLHSQEADLLPDEATMVAVTAAVTDLSLLYWGKAAHSYTIRRGFSACGGLGVSLISMYCRCGSIDSGRRLFAEIPCPNVAHWTAMISGLAAHGLADAAVLLFDEMLQSGVKPNHVTFVSILTACSHGGLIEESLRILGLMKAQRIELGKEHQGCVVDLLARSGRVKEALALAEETEADPETWTAVISACRRRGEFDVAERAARKLAAHVPGHGASYVLLSSMYGEQGHWKEFGRTRWKMKRKGLDKVRGLSWIEVGGTRHQFEAADGSHGRRREIYAALLSLGNHLRSFDADIDLEAPT